MMFLFKIVHFKMLSIKYQSFYSRGNVDVLTERLKSNNGVKRAVLNFNIITQIEFYNAISFLVTGGNRTMVAAATIVSMAAADGERISIFPLVCPNKALCVSFSAPDI